MGNYYCKPALLRLLVGVLIVVVGVGMTCTQYIMNQSNRSVHTSNIRSSDLTTLNLSQNTHTSHPQRWNMSCTQTVKLVTLINNKVKKGYAPKPLSQCKA